jgi:rubredoxin
VNYDQALGRKDGERVAGATRGMELADLLRCPACGGAVERGAAEVTCRDCRRVYPIREGVVLLAGRDGSSRPD